MATLQKTCQRLTEAHARLKSWRAVSEEIEHDHGIHIPAGTLCHISKQAGDYLPRNRLYLSALGLKRKPTPRAPQSLFDYPPAALRWMFEHREVI